MDYEKKYNEAKNKAIEQLSSTPMDKAALYYIFPELRESEDERMMREFNDWLCEEIECRMNDLRDEKDHRTLNMLCYILTKVNDWLEKQKEQKPLPGSEDCDGIPGKDYIPVEWFDACERYGKWKIVEQKPAEWNDTDMKEARENLITCCRDWERGEQTTLLPIVAVRARYFLEHLIEPKPEEWSEGDKAMIECLIRHTQKEFDELCNDRYGHQEIISDLKESCLERMDWLENRLKSLRPQPKKEWSEDEERLINTSISFLKDFADKGYENAVECIDWLKSKLNGNTGK